MRKKGGACRASGLPVTRTGREGDTGHRKKHRSCKRIPESAGHRSSSGKSVVNRHSIGRFIAPQLGLVHDLVLISPPLICFPGICTTIYAHLHVTARCAKQRRPRSGAMGRWLNLTGRKMGGTVEQKLAAQGAVFDEPASAVANYAVFV